MLAAALSALAAAEKPSPRHIYLHIQPKAGLSDAAAARRRGAVLKEVEKTLREDEPEYALAGRLERELDGHLMVRWTVKIWTPAKSVEKMAAVAALFKPEDKVTVKAAPIERRTVEVTDPAALARRLKTDTGAANEWFRERFGPSFPKEFLTGPDGGGYFDFSAVRKGAPGLDSAAVLFDATGRPRSAGEVTKRIRLARAKARVQSSVGTSIKEPPPPLKYAGLVNSAAADRETRAQLRSLIYASRGYEGGFGKRSGLYGPMGLSKMTFNWAKQEAGSKQKKILAKGIHDPEANILAGAIVFARLKSQFGGNVSRAAAAFHVGAGNVRKHGGIPANAKHYLGRFRLAHQQGVRRALDPASPRVVRKVEPEKPLSPIGAIIRRLREQSSAAFHGEPPTGRRESFRNVPLNLAQEIRRMAVDKGWKTDPNVLIALGEAEGGVNAGTSHANARGVLQLTPETALWECGLSRAELANRTQNIACAEKVFARRLAKVDGDVVLAWAMYNTKVKWHRVMINERRVVGIKETVRHVTRSAYRYFQLTGDSRFDPGSRAFREKYFKSRTALRWSADSYRDVQRWDRNEGFKGGFRRAEKVPALEGVTVASGAARAPGRWRRNSTGTHWYRSSRKPGRRWDIYPYRDKSGRITAPPV